MPGLLTQNLGCNSGQIEGGVSGEYCLKLGDFADDLLTLAVIGDQIEWSQAIDLTGVTFIQFWGKSNLIQDGFSGTWLFYFGIDAALEGPFLQNKNTWQPIRANVSGLAPGVHTVRFRLQKVA